MKRMTFPLTFLFLVAVLVAHLPFAGPAAGAGKDKSRGAAPKVADPVPFATKDGKPKMTESAKYTRVK